MQGDVYHLIFELGEWLDGRVWPSEDQLDVLRLVDFIEHVTGKLTSLRLLHLEGQFVMCRAESVLQEMKGRF